jgi:hypothetical protein
MTLDAGTRIGPYEVVAPLGAGGPASVRGCLSDREIRRGLAEVTVIRTDRESRPTRLDVILNWFDDLRRKVG